MYEHVQKSPRRGDGLVKFLQVFNWGLCAFFGVGALSWFAVCLMMLPYPRMVADLGADVTVVFARTAVFLVLTLIAGIATWLLTRRHALQWAGQLVLLAAVGGALAWVWLSI